MGECSAGRDKQHAASGCQAATCAAMLYRDNAAPWLYLTNNVKRNFRFNDNDMEH